VGTIAKVQGVKYGELDNLIGLKDQSNSLTERWFMAIKPGDTEDNPIVKITADWMREWAKDHSIQLSVRKIIWE
jgi:hypothetical protein